MIDLDKKAGRIVSDKERGINPKKAEDGLFSELVTFGLSTDEAYVALQKCLKAARARHSAIPHALAHLVAAGKAIDAAGDALLDRMSDYEQSVSAVRAMAEIDMDASALDGWRELFLARLQNGFGVRVADWMPDYKRLRDGELENRK